MLAYSGQDTVGSPHALGIGSSYIGNTASYILKNTLPLEKIRRDIWSDVYLDLIKLSPNFNEDENDDFCLEQKQLRYQSLPRQNSLQKFTNGQQFLVFLCLYIIFY